MRCFLQHLQYVDRGWCYIDHRQARNYKGPSVQQMRMAGNCSCVWPAAERRAQHRCSPSTRVWSRPQATCGRGRVPRVVGWVGKETTDYVPASRHGDLVASASGHSAAQHMRRNNSFALKWASPQDASTKQLQSPNSHLQCARHPGQAPFRGRAHLHTCRCPGARPARCPSCRRRMKMAGKAQLRVSSSDAPGAVGRWHQRRREGRGGVVEAANARNPVHPANLWLANLWRSWQCSQPCSPC